MMSDVPVRVALVTGATRGIGRSIALNLISRGVYVIGTYRSDESSAARFLGDVGGEGLAEVVRVDLTDMSDLRALVSSLPARLTRNGRNGVLNYLVNNAGTAAEADFADTTEHQFDEMIQVHVKAPFFLTQGVLPILVDGGAILNISSALTRFMFQGVAAYAAAKAALESISRSLAKELGARSIRVNSLAAGAVATDLGSGATRDPLIASALSAGIAFGRIGEPDDIGRAAAALLSNDLAWATGARFEISGGQLI